MRTLALLTILALSAWADCALDSQGNQICVTTQKNSHVCGCLDMFGSCHFLPVYCDDVVVTKTAPDGTPVYTKVLGGQSEQRPSQFAFDAQGNLILLGTTWSNDFPTTPDAVQLKYAGPAPVSTTDGYPPLPGGDLFLSVLTPAGDLAYSTYLGSSGSDLPIGMHVTPPFQFDVLAGAGAGDFTQASANPTGGAVVFTFDAASRMLAHSAYLPVNGYASWRTDGAIQMVTSDGLYVFDHNALQLSFVSLASFHFRYPPSTATDPAGDLWLVGNTNAGRAIVTKFTGSVTEAFRWTVPASGYLSPPQFSRNGLAYLGGFGSNLVVSSNALLTEPCYYATSAAIVVVLDPQGQPQLVTYVPVAVVFFSFDADGNASAILEGGNNKRIALDLTIGPRAICTDDLPPFGVGQVVRLRGGGFGPPSPVTPSLGLTGLYPTSVGTTQVLVNGVAAPILYAAFGEVLFQVPFETAEDAAVPIVIVDSGQQSAPLPVAIRTLMPRVASSVLNADGTPNHYDNPAAWGSVVTVRFTGGGPYDPPLADGEIAPALLTSSLAAPVTISDGTIVYAGPAPGVVGVAQLNIQLPPARSAPDFFPQVKIGSANLYVPVIVAH